MKNKNGFISMALVYTFLILFLFIMLAILSCYKDKNKFLSAINDRVNIDIGASKDGKNTLFNKMLEDNIATPTTNLDFSNIATSSNGRGLFYEDDETKGRMYFFRGNVSNNYVLFGREFKDKEDVVGNKICWKILHTDNNDSIKLIYSGVLQDDGSCNSKSNGIGNSKFNENSNDNAYVGYSYGGEKQDNYSSTHHYIVEEGANIKTDSTIKGKLESWYMNNTNLASYTNLIYGNDTSVDIKDNYVADTVFCNDRKVSDNNIYGFKQVVTKYESRNRIDSKIKPTIYCESQNDAYSLSTTVGGLNGTNSAIVYPIGLITVDEVRYAGGALGKSNSTYYLNNSNKYWTMSPDGYYSDGAKLFIVESNGSISSTLSNTENVILPVIALKKNTLVDRGTGYYDNPYIIG